MDTLAVESLLHRIRQADSINSIATDALRFLAESSQASRPTDQARLLRCILHLRPDGAYAGIYGWSAVEEERELSSLDLSPSLNIWKWVDRLRRPLQMDITTGSVWSLMGEPLTRQTAKPTSIRGSKSQSFLLKRRTTHVIALPVEIAARGVIGMACLEWAFPDGLGGALSRKFLSDDLALLGRLILPYLASAPSAPPPLAVRDPMLPVVGTSMAPIVAMLRSFSRSKETILFSGPTGSGKSRMAHWCHAHSRRSEGPFEAVDLLSVPEETQLGELFGWKRGAFTGAMRDHPGRVGLAEGGTLFLDEVDKLSLRAQAGLLQFLEDRKYRPLGDPSAGPKVADVRLMVGTNADLQALVRSGSFREDLYYRIHVLPVRLPSLAERHDEIAGWAEVMAARCIHERVRVVIEPTAIQLLRVYPWPGNLRQLDNVVRRAVIFAQSRSDTHESFIAVSAPDVELALSYEHGLTGDHADLDLLGALRVAAEAFVKESLRREQAGREPLSLDLADALKALILSSALRTTGNRELACKLTGRETLVRNRNHHRMFTRASEQVAELGQALGICIEDELRALGTESEGA